jgi:DNA-binding transcriptional LysR family regulator
LRPSQSGTRIVVPVISMRSPAAGVAAIGGTLLAAIGLGASTAPPRGVVRTTWFGGSLLEVLPGQLRADPVPIHAVTLQGRQRLPKVRAVLEHLQRWIGPG